SQGWDELDWLRPLFSPFLVRDLRGSEQECKGTGQRTNGDPASRQGAFPAGRGARKGFSCLRPWISVRSQALRHEPVPHNRITGLRRYSIRNCLPAGSSIRRKSELQSI